jgi:tripartite-type tricarboxylate transporter receptor subunit TctC
MMRLSLYYFLVLALGVSAIATAVGTSSAASNWPTRPVKLIVPLGPGSGTDIGARLLADRLALRWGQPVFVENRTGGDGIVAINAFVTAHDDHVLLLSPTSSFTAHPFLHDNLPYTPNDLVPITRVSNTIITIAVPIDMKANSLGELITMIRAEPGKFNWAGVTGALDFMFAGWLKHEDLSMTKVAYRNAVDAANDLAEGRVHVYEAALAIVQPQLKSGKIKLLAVTNTTRAPTVPNLPTVQEAGQPLLMFNGLVGLFGPTGIPMELRRQITSDIGAVADKTIEDRLITTGQILNLGGPEEFGRSIEEQRATVARFAKDIGIQPMQKLP